MTNIDLHYSVETLDKLDPVYNNFIIPSDKIYYGKYAYKVTFATPGTFNLEDYTDTKEGLRLLETHFRDRLYQYIGAPREHDDSNRPEHIEEKIIARQKDAEPLCKQFIYLRSFNDLIKVISEFKDYIEIIEGPVSQTHFELLLSKQYRCEVRTCLWYKKYDYKVSMFLPYRTAYGFTKEEKRAKIAEIVDFLKENLSSEAFKTTGITNFYYHTSSNFLEFYTKSESFDVIYPFISMMFNDWRLIVTKAYLR